MTKKYGRENVLIIDLDGQKSVTTINEIRKLNKIEPTLNILLSDSVEKTIEFIGGNNDKIIIVDTGGFDQDYNRYVMVYSDIIVTPVSDAPIETIRLREFDQKILSSINKNLKNTSVLKKVRENKKQQEIRPYVVFNRIHPNIRNIPKLRALYEDSTNLNFLESIIRDRIPIKTSIADGSSVSELLSNDDGENAMTELQNLFDEIENLIKG
jgi:chromosome partitioning protein